MIRLGGFSCGPAQFSNMLKDIERSTTAQSFLTASSCREFLDEEC